MQADDSESTRQFRSSSQTGPALQLRSVSIVKPSTNAYGRASKAYHHPGSLAIIPTARNPGTTPHRRRTNRYSARHAPVKPTMEGRRAASCVGPSTPTRALTIRCSRGGFASAGSEAIKEFMSGRVATMIVKTSSNHIGRCELIASAVTKRLSSTSVILNTSWRSRKLQKRLPHPAALSRAGRLASDFSVHAVFAVSCMGALYCRSNTPQADHIKPSPPPAPATTRQTPTSPHTPPTPKAPPQTKPSATLPEPSAHGSK